MKQNVKLKNTAAELKMKYTRTVQKRVEDQMFGKFSMKLLMRKAMLLIIFIFASTVKQLYIVIVQAEVQHNF